MSNSFRSRRATLTGNGAELKSAVHAGATAGTNIPITGIKRSDILVAVLDDSFGNHLAHASIPSDGNLKIVTDDTSAGIVFVLWWSF